MKPGSKMKLFPNLVIRSVSWQTFESTIGTSTFLSIAWFEPYAKSLRPHPATEHRRPGKLIGASAKEILYFMVWDTSEAYGASRQLQWWDIVLMAFSFLAWAMRWYFLNSLEHIADETRQFQHSFQYTQAARQSSSCPIRPCELWNLIS